MRMGPLPWQGSPFHVCLSSSKILCWGSLRPVALALGKMQGWDRSLCPPFPPQASATPWPLSLKYCTVWTFSPLTLIKTYETAEVLRACVTRPSSHSRISDSDHIPSSFSLPAAAAPEGTSLGQSAFLASRLCLSLRVGGQGAVETA